LRGKLTRIDRERTTEAAGEGGEGEGKRGDAVMEGVRRCNRVTSEERGCRHGLFASFLKKFQPNLGGHMQGYIMGTNKTAPS
jgi:hypothetical protein